MSSSAGGVQVRIKVFAPLATYPPCAGQSQLGTACFVKMCVIEP